MLYAIVVYKEGGEFPYEGVYGWKVVGDWLILARSRHEKILIPSDAVTSVEIREDKEADNDR
jgi:hypothetical protein